MKLLLDTHIWLWYALGNPQLSVNLRTIIAASTTELWISPISVWEVLLLTAKGLNVGWVSAASSMLFKGWALREKPTAVYK